MQPECHHPWFIITRANMPFMSARGRRPCDLVDMVQNALSSCHSEVMWSNCKYITVTRQNETLLTFSMLRHSVRTGWQTKVVGSILRQNSLSLRQRKCSAESFSKQQLIGMHPLARRGHQQGRCLLSWQLKRGPPSWTTISRIMTPPCCPRTNSIRRLLTALKWSSSLKIMRMYFLPRVRGWTRGHVYHQCTMPNMAKMHFCLFCIRIPTIYLSDFSLCSVARTQNFIQWNAIFDFEKLAYRLYKTCRSATLIGTTAAVLTLVEVWWGRGGVGGWLRTRWFLNSYHQKKKINKKKNKKKKTPNHVQASCLM